MNSIHGNRCCRLSTCSYELLCTTNNEMPHTTIVLHFEKDTFAPQQSARYNTSSTNYEARSGHDTAKFA